MVTWYKVPQIPDGKLKPDLLVRVTKEVHGGNFTAAPRYELAPDLSLVIKSVVREDGGTYQCRKVASTEANNRENNVEVVVVGKDFYRRQSSFKIM